MAHFRVVGIGAGYFAGFQYRAWQRIPEVAVTALSNRNRDRAQPLMEQCHIPRHYTDWQQMLDEEKPDIVDIITPPPTHLEMCRAAADRGIHIVCQKPLAPTFDEARQIVAYVAARPIRFMVHENWRFQPWYREMKRLIVQGTIGEPHSIYFRSRMGDGWGQQAYIPRQPYFRQYPRFLVYENGIHFIDTFRYLFGEVAGVYAVLRRMNPLIQGEDAAHVVLHFSNGAKAFWDANRYNEPNHENPRLTFGQCLLEGSAGAIRLYADGRITTQELGEAEMPHDYPFTTNEFSADCVYFTQRHFIDCMLTGAQFESNGPDYLKSLIVQEAVYASAQTNSYVEVPRV